MMEKIAEKGPAAGNRAETSFAEVSEQIKRLINQNQNAEAEAIISEYLESKLGQVERLVLEGARHYVRREYPQAYEKIRQAISGGNKESQISDLKSQISDFKSQITHPQSVYSAALVYSQVAVPRGEGSVRAKGYEIYKRNIAVLREVDGELAGEVQKAAWPAGWMLVDYWDGLHIFSKTNQILLILAGEIKNELVKYTAERVPIGFGGVCTGQELKYCLEHQGNWLHGMKRAHYLFEEDAGKLKALLHLFDMSGNLTSQELIIFGGGSVQRRFDEVFDTLLYAAPRCLVGDLELVESYTAQLKGKEAALSRTQETKAYYASGEFRERLGKIAAGEVQPRIMVITCRWTTFLKYCAADFAKAFEQAGCEVVFAIEENDVQSQLNSYLWRKLGEFRPDAVFIVSHSRATASFLPRELAVIGYILDKCGPLLEMPQISEHVAPVDLFVCLSPEHQRFIREKGVRQEQTFVMPVPVDETMFYPLGKEHEQAKRYQVDVSFVKHGHAEGELVLEEFIQGQLRYFKLEEERAKMAEIFRRLYARFCTEYDKRYYEQEMQEYVLSYVRDEVSPEIRHKIKQMVTYFYITVHSAAWRSQFLESLDEAGIELAIYGNGWDRHKRLKHRARGAVERQEELNYVYNFSRINLNINQAGTMHPRLAECGLAGGFMMVADHPQDKDWGPARPYFAEGKEVVFFDTRAELVERCRYYLAHEDERREIAHNMRQRALQERTCRAGAMKILEEWRKLLRGVSGEAS